MFSNGDFVVQNLSTFWVITKYESYTSHPSIIIGDYNRYSSIIFTKDNYSNTGMIISKSTHSANSTYEDSDFRLVDDGDLHQLAKCLTKYGVKFSQEEEIKEFITELMIWYLSNGEIDVRY